MNPDPTRTQPRRSFALLAALPDAAMALLFAAVWIAPLEFPRDQLSSLALVMLLEFLLMHATVLLGTMFAHANQLGSRRTVLTLVALLALFYLAFVAFLASGFDAWWPYVAFAWLLTAKLAGYFLSPAAPERERDRQMLIWVACAVVYLLGVFVTLLLPLPALALTPEVVAQLKVDGFGAWVDAPQKLCAFGMLYFGACALLRARAGTQRTDQRRSSNHTGRIA